MSVIQEYLKLIPKALGNPKEVVQGWMNVVREELGTLPEDQLEEVIRRRLICGSCPFMSENAKKTSGYKDKRRENHCILCSCPIKSKTASMDSVCGAQYYNQTHPNLPQIEVKWTAYEARES